MFNYLFKGHGICFKVEVEALCTNTDLLSPKLFVYFMEKMFIIKVIVKLDGKLDDVNHSAHLNNSRKILFFL